jgi:hypothetical protein
MGLYDKEIKMQYSHLEGNRVYFYETLVSCKKCNRAMLFVYTSASKKITGLPQESRYFKGVCTDCAYEGGFSHSCDICGNKHILPTEFKYKIRHDAKYDGEETFYEYICKNCVKNKPDEVIAALAISDETITLSEFTLWGEQHGSL